jgi:RNA polymerase sigma-70 factor, ECF subfamily
MSTKSISSLSAIFFPGTATAADEQRRSENLAIAAGLKRQAAGLIDELIVRYQHRLLRYLLYLTSNRELAEDLFQEVWMRVLVRGSQYNGQARFETWLFTIARNLLIDQRRKRTMSSLDELFETGGDDDRPMASLPRSKSSSTLKIVSALPLLCWNWIRCTAKFWYCDSTRNFLSTRSPK